MSERNGRLTVEGNRAVLNFERRLPFPIDVVWSAITDPDEREQWFGETTIDAREGGTIEMVAKAFDIPVADPAAIYRADFLPARSTLTLKR